MHQTDFTEEQQKDIEERVAKAVAMLKELNLRPASSVSATNIGNDVFAQKIVTYLQDTKYEPKLSPIQP